MIKYDTWGPNRRGTPTTSQVAPPCACTTTPCMDACSATEIPGFGMVWSHAPRRESSVYNLNSGIAVVQRIVRYSRKLTPASVFRHPWFQSGTGIKKNARLHQFSLVPTVPAPLVFFILVPEWLDAGQSGIPAFWTISRYFHKKLKYIIMNMTKRRRETSCWCPFKIIRVFLHAFWC
jgi:hypothetical protein